MRKCPCGSVIEPTQKTVDWGAAHGRDLKTWPAKCNACIVDWALGMFERVEAGGMEAFAATPAPTPPGPKCARCSAPLDLKKDKGYQDVPGVGDLCLGCWGAWVRV